MPSRRAFLSTVPMAAAAAQNSESGFQPVSGWTIVEGPETAYIVTPDEIAVQGHATFPTWLRSGKQYENFDLRGEFFVKGWTDSGIYIHAPEHGRPTSAGFQMKVFHGKDTEPKTNSVGAILGAIAPRLVNVHDGWNEFRVLCDWPRLQIWMNGELVHDHNCATHPALNQRLRSGYVGIAAASVPVRFRNFRIKELPGKEQWISLYEKPEDLAANWVVSEGKPDIVAMGGVLRGDGAGHMATKERYRDFHFQCYIRGCAQHNGGIIFRSAGRGTDPLRSYEIQLHPVEEAHFPTGSLYHLKRAVYPRIQDEKWFHFDLWVMGREARVRIDGETVLEYDELERRDAGFIELQTHRRGYWLEFKHIRVQRL